MNWGLKLSLEHPNLVQYEVESILKKKVTWISESLGLVNSEITEMDYLAKSSAVVKYILVNPLTLGYDQLLNADPIDNFETCIDWIDDKKDPTFRVTHHHVGIHEDKSNGDAIERNIGSWIWNYRSHLKVDLKNPKFVFYVFSSPEISMMGWCYKEVPFSPISARAPKHGPYFQGGNMKPRLSRIVVNLLQPLPSVICDPFVGHGGIMREAADQGSFCIGIEISKRVMRECLENNRYFGYEDRIAIIFADSLKPPLRRRGINSIVSDPPYSIQTTTNGIGTEELIKRWLGLQQLGVTIVFTVPNTVMDQLPEGWSVDLDELDYVHGGLTRRIRKVRRI